MDILRGLLPLDRSRLTGDVLAGVTLAALAIPEVMGYTKISGTPVVTGLYTLLLPVIAFAVLGASRHLVVAADSATAAILASMLVAIAPLGSPDYVGLTSLTALVVAVMLVLARVFRLGFLADFLSRSALIGFLTGVGVQVAGGELSGLLGLAKEGHDALTQVVSTIERLGAAHAGTLAVSLAVLAVIVACERFAPRIPGALMAVIGAIAASAALDLAARGVATIGAVPSGLPSLSLPPLHASDLAQVVACAASCFIVIVAQSAATARAYAMRYEERFDGNPDLIGLAGANAAAALTGTFVVNGSPTKTEMVDEAGGRSQVAPLAMAAVVLVVLLFLTKPLSFMPNAVLSAIVFLIGVKLVDVKGMRELFRLQRDEFWIALLTAATVVLHSVMAGIAVAVVLSLIDQVRHTYRPRTRILVPGHAGAWTPLPAAPGRLAAPGVLAYRFEADLFYANASRFAEEVLSLVAKAGEPVRTVILDASGIDNVDYSAAKTLLQTRAELRKRGVEVAAVATPDGVLDDLRRYGLGGAGAELFPTLDAALAAVVARSAAAAPATDAPAAANP
ncbi:MAG: SulP family inorganic anion transporter [Gammaproteobacteria bacterium]|jgi:high affinity sulfate transporter 1|nr:SulP family inorganic anion transporter [Gammaproteobacteria bacterium]